MNGAGDIESLRKSAAGGDHGAQYALAAALSRAGHRDEAERWLNAAADGGCADALYTLATRRLYRTELAEEGAGAVRRAADAGSTLAQRLLAVLQAMGVGVARDDAAALAAVERIAHAGDPRAMAELAALYCLEDANDPRIGALLAPAATTDPVAAAFVLVRAGSGSAQETAEIAALAGAAKLLGSLNYPRADQLTDSEKNAAKAARARNAPQRRGPPFNAEPERLSQSPDVVLYRSAVPPALCEYLIAHAASRLGPSLVYDPQAARMVRDPLRTSATASLSPVDLDLAIVALNRRLAAMAGAPDENGEFLSVLHYAPGQEYRPHFDCIPPGADLERSGQRAKTALLYLNDDYEGGETTFTETGLLVRGGVGDILVFSNLDAAGNRDPRARHAGLPVRAGVKWLASKWFRTQKFKF